MARGKDSRVLVSNSMVIVSSVVIFYYAQRRGGEKVDVGKVVKEFEESVAESTPARERHRGAFVTIERLTRWTLGHGGARATGRETCEKWACSGPPAAIQGQGDAAGERRPWASCIIRAQMPHVGTWCPLEVRTRSTPTSSWRPPPGSAFFAQIIRRGGRVGLDAKSRLDIT